MKKLLLTILLPSLILAYQPASPPPVLLTAPPDIEPTRVVAIIPAIVIGAVVVGGVAWGGLKIANRILDIWEHQVTNGAPDKVVFTFAEEYPE